MRLPKVIAGFTATVLAVLLLLLYCQVTRKYVRFKHQSTKYHSAVAVACDFMLAHYLVGGTNGVEVPATDTALPQVIRNLHPLKIKLERNWVWILVGDSHLDGLNITWEPQDESHTNIWNLSIGNGEGPSEVVYVARR
jgi:hypothetical protein